MSLIIGWIIFMVNLANLRASKSSQPPHIVFIYADDLGWNDISLHGSQEIPTPNIDAMALNGIVLQNYYGEWLCTPSRAALLTGMYPMRLGLQHSVILGGEATGLPLNATTMPQRFKELGYATHMIGKWHLGYQNKEYTPTYRGFDTFFGYYNGFNDYYTHTYYENFVSISGQPIFGLDWFDGLTPVRDGTGNYATHAFTERAEQIIQDHDTSKPLFLYLAHLAPHSGNAYQYNQAPADVVSQFMYIKDVNRRIHAAVIKILDDSLGAVFSALFEKSMLDNTIIVFASDNGAEVNPDTGGFGSNYPLRGNKWTYWEGGIHVPAIIWSPLLNLEKPRISQQLMHVTDWLPTLYSFAGGNVKDLGSIDGRDASQALTSSTPSNPRDEMLQNLDSGFGTAALRVGHLKVVTSTPTNQPLNQWYGTSGYQNFTEKSTYEQVFKNGSLVRDVLEAMGMWIVQDPDDVYQKLNLTCEKPPPKEASECDASKKPCLFNITEDPCEYHNLADIYPDTVDEMMGRILKYQSEEMTPQAKMPDPAANPLCHDFLYVPWLDPDQHEACDFLS